MLKGDIKVQFSLKHDPIQEEESECLTSHLHRAVRRKTSDQHPLRPSVDCPLSLRSLALGLRQPENTEKITLAKDVTACCVVTAYIYIHTHKTVNAYLPIDVEVGYKRKHAARAVQVRTFNLMWRTRLEEAKDAPGIPYPSIQQLFSSSKRGPHNRKITGAIASWKMVVEKVDHTARFSA